MIRPFHGFAYICLGIAGAACVAIPGGDPSVAVYAVAETKPVGTQNEDAADDPAIWRNAKDPAKSLIIGTDKKAGLYVYNLDGEQLSFLAGAGLNNVDLLELQDGRIMVAASDRSDLATAHIHLSWLDPGNGTLTYYKRIAVGAGEGYGICMRPVPNGGEIEIISAPKNGVIYSTQITPEGAVTRQSTITEVSSQPEGCVIDERSGTLFIGEEVKGIWEINLAQGTKQLIAATGTGMLVPDVEGLAIAPEGADGGYLVASSQGDNTYAVYGLPDHTPLGRFRIALGQFGATEETDGIALDPRSFGPDYPGGLFVAQDGINPPNAQNFKLARWDEVLAALSSDATE